MSDVLSQLGLELNIDDGDLVSDAVLVFKVHRPDGTVYVACRQTEGTDWVTARGLIAVGADIGASGYEEGGG